ncbi:hypothetical protein SAMN05216327_10453 [Dyadobacter sp. SG02]|nr:hypothetical protein SAMN05216327_10453 [Dyadobacter sp. SG02]
MQNYLCKRLHSDYMKLPFSYDISTSYRLISDKNEAIMNLIGEGYFLQKSYKYWQNVTCLELKFYKKALLRKSGTGLEK